MRKVHIMHNHKLVCGLDFNKRDTDPEYGGFDQITRATNPFVSEDRYCLPCLKAAKTEVTKQAMSDINVLDEKIRKASAKRDYK